MYTIHHIQPMSPSIPALASTQVSPQQYYCCLWVECSKQVQQQISYSDIVSYAATPPNVSCLLIQIQIQYNIDMKNLKQLSQQHNNNNQLPQQQQPFRQQQQSLPGIGGVDRQLPNNLPMMGGNNNMQQQQRSNMSGAGGSSHHQQFKNHQQQQQQMMAIQQQQQQLQMQQQMRMQQQYQGGGCMEGQEDEIEEDIMDDDEIQYMILELGNDILRMLGVENLPVNDIELFFSDAFYMQFFEAAFPDFDFSELQPGQTDEQVGENIQALIDLLQEELMRGVDLTQVSGMEIALGNIDHCVELLQIIHQMTAIMAENSQSGSSPNKTDSMGQSVGQSLVGGVHPTGSIGGQSAEKHLPAVHIEQQRTSGVTQQMQDEDDDYDDEDEDDDLEEGGGMLMQQRLSPLQSKQLQPAPAIDDNKDDDDFGFNDLDNGVVEQQQEEQEIDDDSESGDDDYDQLIKRGRLLHSHIEKDHHKPATITQEEKQKEVEEIDEEIDNYEEDGFEEAPQGESSQSKSNRQLPNVSSSQVESSQSHQSSQKKGVKSKVSVSGDDFRDYGEDGDDGDEEGEYDDEEEEVVVPVVKKVVEFPWKKAEPIAADKEPQVLLYGSLTQKKDADENNQSTAAVQILSSKPLTSTIFNPPAAANPINNPPTNNIFFNHQQQQPPPLQQPENLSISHQPTNEQPVVANISRQQSLNNKSSQQSSQRIINSTSKRSHIEEEAEKQQPAELVTLQDPDIQIAEQHYNVQKEELAPPPQPQKKRHQDSPPAIVPSNKQEQIESVLEVEQVVLSNIDKLDKERKLQMVQQLQAEYDRCPKEFPFPRELIYEYVMGEQMKSPVRDQHMSSPGEYTNEQDEQERMKPSFMLSQDLAEPRQGRTKKARPQTAATSKQKQQKRLEEIEFMVKRGLVGDEELNELSDVQLKEIIKTQQKLLSKEREKYQVLKRSRSRPQTAAMSQKKLTSSDEVELQINKPTFNKRIEKPQTQKKKKSALQSMKPIKTDDTLKGRPRSKRNTKGKKTPAQTSITIEHATLTKDSRRQLDAPRSSRTPDRVGNSHHNRRPSSQTRHHLSSAERSNNSNSKLRSLSAQRASPNKSHYSILSSIAKERPTNLYKNENEQSHNLVSLDLTDSQLVQLVKVAESLPRDQQKMLVQVLSDKIGTTPKPSRHHIQLNPDHRANQDHYKGLYQKLMETFKKAKQNQKPSQKKVIQKQDDIEDRLRKSEAQAEHMVRQYQQQVKQMERKSQPEDIISKRALRDQKIEHLKEKRLYDHILRKQMQSEAHRKDQHEKMQMYFKKMARDMQKERLQESREMKKMAAQNGPGQDQGGRIVKKIESIFNTRVQLLKEKLESEKYDRQVSQQAQLQLIASLNKDLKETKRKEVNRYNELLAKQSHLVV